MRSMKSAAVYARLTAVILSAVAVVAMTFGLFNSVLKDLIPQVEGAAQAVNFVSFGTVIVLLSLTLLVRKRLSVISQYAWAGVGVVCLVVAVFTYFSFSDLVRRYVYLFPPVSAPGMEQRPFVRGPYHELGKQRAAGMDVPTAVDKFGGPGFVNGHQLLWSEESRSEVVGWFVRYYAAIAFLMTTALFVVAIAVWRTLRDEQGPRGGRRDAPESRGRGGQEVASGRKKTAAQKPGPG